MPPAMTTCRVNGMVHAKLNPDIIHFNFGILDDDNEFDDSWDDDFEPCNTCGDAAGWYEWCEECHEDEWVDCEDCS